ncbi:unnamed protein product [Aspergillus oryzae]|uniref:Unnamed protein product n=1 Tax=Aspergillus oryzae var. brunneus TaxID=332754 RepID=A0ABQ6L012_ASPOZ|nr:unnamed protein product [Aspergillus oryzae]GMF90437.1 unnamed protein product [Aspergillus oryzae]GMG07536.1 unnamed protein product [Aspergillus oryzae]GMG51039.1 unnamed protein product [Aspergillus oryzae var. brunneus]
MPLSLVDGRGHSEGTCSHLFHSILPVAWEARVILLDFEVISRPLHVVIPGALIGGVNQKSQALQLHKKHHNPSSQALCRKLVQ